MSNPHHPTAVTPHLRGLPLPEHLRNLLRSLVVSEGEVAASMRLGLSRVTLARALAGLGLRRATIAYLTYQLELPPTTPENGGTP